MSNHGIFDTVGELITLDEDFALANLRERQEGEEKNPRVRIDRLITARANMHTGFSTFGGNSSYLIEQKGRLVRKNAFGFSAASLRRQPVDPDIPDIDILPLGIRGLTHPDKQPIFHEHDADMRSIVLKVPAGPNKGYLEEPVEPLFNIHKDGTVLVRFRDQPTPEELKLFYEIVEAFEYASSFRPAGIQPENSAAF